MGSTYRLSCPYAAPGEGHDHASEYWDEIDTAVEACRARASACQLGRLEDGIPAAGLVTCEAEAGGTPIWQQLAGAP